MLNETDFFKNNKTFILSWSPTNKFCADLSLMMVENTQKCYHEPPDSLSNVNTAYRFEKSNHKYLNTLFSI